MGRYELEMLKRIPGSEDVFVVRTKDVNVSSRSRKVSNLLINSNFTVTNSFIVGICFAQYQQE